MSTGKQARGHPDVYSSFTYVHACLRVCARVYVLLGGGQKTASSATPQVLFNFCFSKDNPSLPWNSLSRLGYRLDNEPQELSCLQPPQRLRLQERSHLIVFKQGFRGSHSSPHICKASTLLSCLPRGRLMALYSPFITDTCL